MIEVAEALNTIVSKVLTNPVVEIEMASALNCVLAENVYSPIAMPPFNQSAMDGYALCGNRKNYRVEAEIKAGDSAEELELNLGEAARIFTGAMVPKNIWAIAKQEIVVTQQNRIELLQTVNENANIRLSGEELELDALAMQKGEILNPAAIGFLNGLGITSVKVYNKPNIALVVTGNELIRPGQELPKGKIFESNAAALSALLKSMGFEPDVSFVKDDYHSTLKVIDQAIEKHDLVIVTGGVSVGDYDYTYKVFEELGVEKGFYKVNQKPGKPLYFGLKGDVSIFGLPGNPAAALTCFYIYVLAAIRLKMGFSMPFLEKKQLIIAHDQIKKGARAHFLKAKQANGFVSVNHRQSSAMLSSFIDANCLVYLPSEDQRIAKGSAVDTFILP